MQIKRIVLIKFFGLFCCFIFAQKNQLSSFTLNECISIAIENNVDLKSAELAKKASIINHKQSKNNLLPTINGDYNLGVNNGRSIDPFTNDFSNEELTFSNLGLNLDVTVFNGFEILNTIKQNKFKLEAAKMEQQEVKQNLILNVTLGYIQILNSRGLVELSKTRLKATEKQLKRLEINYNEGLGNPANYTDIKGQYTVDKLAIVNAENNYKSTILDFINLLGLDIDSKKDFKNLPDLIKPNRYPFSAKEIYNDALQNLAVFKSKQNKIDAADSGIKIAKAGYFPEVSFFGQLNTNYSSLTETFTETGTTISQTDNFVTIENQDLPVLQNQTQFTGNKVSYKNQLEDNFNTVVGVSVSVPIFSSFNTKNNIALQKLELEETELELQNTKLLFKQSIEKAYNDMDLAFNRYYILLDQVAAYKESYRINEVRFNNGVSNIVEYITSKNNMDRAQLNLNNAKYEYLLRVKVLDFYKGV